MHYFKTVVNNSILQKNSQQKNINSNKFKNKEK